jgi:glycosyltransferase involved in cell wall biosynthesis
MAELGGMHVAVVDNADPTDVSRWSGIPHHMIGGLVEAGARVTPISVAWRSVERPLHLAARVRNSVSRDRYLPDRERILLQRYARRVERELDRCRPDVVISPGTLAVSYVRTSIPLGVWVDATIRGLLGYYPSFTGWSERTIGNAFAAEGAAMSRASMVIGASEWAVTNAREQVPEVSGRCTVVPFGANLQDPPARIRRHGPRSTRLLLVGVEWHRKGADIAVAASAVLQGRGRPVELDIVGCRPPQGTVLPEHVRVHAFVDKGTSQGRRHLASLYERADVLLLPSRAECSPVVLCEAAAFGLPAVAARTGGIPTTLHDAVTGILVDPETGATGYANAVEAILDDHAAYARMSEAARERFDHVLNWRSACIKTVEGLASAAGRLQ